MTSSVASRLYTALDTLLVSYEDTLGNAYRSAEINAMQEIVEARAALAAYRNYVDGTDYEALYDEAMVASNEAGYVGLTAAQTIRDLHASLMNSNARITQLEHA